MAPQYQPVQGVVNPPGPYYQANQAGKQIEYKVGSWSCNQCTYVNYPGRTVCEVCGYIQSPSTSEKMFSFLTKINNFWIKGENLHTFNPVLNTVTN